MPKSAGWQAVDAQCRRIVEDARNGIFAPVYLLMGTEPFYPEMVCGAIIDNCLQDYEKDFNETICYGGDTDAETVITAARRYPMMADRQLVVVKEAQQMRTVDQLALYCEKPLDSTVLVILMHGAAADKRKSLYKTASKVGVVVESNELRDYEIGSWITAWYSSRGLRIDPEAAALLGESAGTDLGKIAVETDKMLKNLPEGTVAVTAGDVEKNVGISRQFSVFELTKALSYRDAKKALWIAAHVGNAPRFAMPMAVSALYMHFSRLLRYNALLLRSRRPDPAEKQRALSVSPYFFREYDAAVANYPLPQCMGVISLLCDYDLKGKGGEVGEATQGELLTELVAKILSIGAGPWRGA